MRVLAIVLLAALVLSGCASSDDEGGGGTVTTGPDGKTTSKAPTTSGGGGGGTGTITVKFERTTIDGPAPLKVNFTLDATFKDAAGKDAKPAAAVSVTYRQIGDANGTAMTGAASNGPSISSLPTTFSLTFEEAGKFEVVATVKATGYADGKGQIIILPRVPGGGGGVSGGVVDPIFFDGGEGDASQWTIASTVLVTDPLALCEIVEDTTAPFTPERKWAINSEKKTGAASWYSDYPDNYHGVMTSLDIDVPSAGARLEFAIKGGTETNCLDGVHILAGPVGGELTDMEFMQGPFTDWTTKAYNIPGGAVTVQFMFDTDGSCSNDTSIPSTPVVACGPGFDLGGFWIDDITVY